LKLQAWFKSELTRYGEIDQVRIFRDKSIAFVHFTTIRAAMQCIESTIFYRPCANF